MTRILGTSEDNSFTGTSDNETYVLWQGGNDTVTGDGGNDQFRMGATFDENDSLDGGDGEDKVSLNGDYSGGLDIDASMMVNVERLRLLGDFDYSITTANDVVAAGERLFVNAAPLKGGHGLTFNGSAETDGSFLFCGSAGDDDIIGGHQRDKFFLDNGGNDTVHAYKGNDSIVLGSALTASDQIDGGEGFDQVYLNGDYSGAHAVVFNATTMIAVERIVLAGGHSYDLTTDDATVDSFHNLTLIVDARRLGATDTARIDGSAEADSNFTMKGGAGNDNFTGGAFADDLRGNGGDDTLAGGGGLDTMSGGAGADTFFYFGTGDSNGLAHDSITDFDATEDSFLLTLTPSNIGATPIVNHSVGFATFDTDMGSAVADFISHGAMIIHANGGDFIGHDFLFVDASGDGNYDSGTDYLVDITGYTGTLSDTNFI